MLDIAVKDIVLCRRLTAIPAEPLLAAGFTSVAACAVVAVAAVVAWYAVRSVPLTDTSSGKGQPMKLGSQDAKR